MNDTQLFKHSFNFLNLNYSSCQGLYVYHNVLSHCGDPIADLAFVSEIPERIELLTGWYQELWESRPVMADGDKAQTLCSMLRDVEKIIPEYASLLKARLSDNQPEERDIPFMMAALARQAYTRESFVNATIAYAEHTEMDELADFWRQHILSVNEDVSAVSFRLEQYKNRDNMEELRAVLAEECGGMHETVEAQLGDIREVFSGYAADSETQA